MQGRKKERKAKERERTEKGNNEKKEKERERNMESNEKEKIEKGREKEGGGRKRKGKERKAKERGLLDMIRQSSMCIKHHRILARSVFLWIHHYGGIAAMEEQQGRAEQAEWSQAGP